MGDFSFQVHHVDAGCAARRSTLSTPHGPVEMPTFMPVATQAAVKGLTAQQLAATGTTMVLANTYHLMLRPGTQVIEALSGLHRFMGWAGPILTDSGGFQIYSLAERATVTEDGAEFRSHIDGRLVRLTPEEAVQIQQSLGSDIAMVLDHVVGLPNDPAVVHDAAERTIRWAARCRRVADRHSQLLFAIVQGGLNLELRTYCARRLCEMDFPGYAIGGLSVGETPQQMYQVLEATVPHLPADRPRYLMGVGRPEDLLEAIRQGIDMFDCVMPTRNGRNAMAFTDAGPLRLRNAQHQCDPRPLETGCPCAACRHSRGYIRHLFMAGEMLGPILLSIHNITFYQRLMSQCRQAIEEDRFVQFAAEKLRRWQS